MSDWVTEFVDQSIELIDWSIQGVLIELIDQAINSLFHLLCITLYVTQQSITHLFIHSQPPPQADLG